MFKILSAREAIDLIKDGDCVAINSFIAWSNPEALHDALYERIVETGAPKDLRIFCAAGFGAWDENRLGDRYMNLGAVKEVIAGHYGGMPGAVKAALENKIEAYNLPLGVLSHTVNAAAAGRDWYISEVGVGLFCDPRVDSYALNDISKKELVKVVEIEGKEHLLYYTPKPDVALIRGTTADPDGSISFEKEYCIIDAFALAQATKRNGGTVIVEVERISHEFSRPRNVIIPGILVDVVVVSETKYDREEYNPALSGDIHVPVTQMDYYIKKLSAATEKPGKDNTKRNVIADIISHRASHELRPGQIVNLGIGIPENVGLQASKHDLLKDIYITVEAGGIGGLPAPGRAFGATIGADMICEMSTLFDFYEGGGLDICFLGGLEVDQYGNVNSHKMEGYYSGIGGFANITFATKNIVFCLSFTAKGLTVSKTDDDVITIEKEGSIKKFKKEVSAISFSGKHAAARGQRVLYVTERCVFELTTEGLKLKEVYPGIDEQTQIRDLLDFDV